MNRLQALHDAGISIWLDTLSRGLLETGGLADLIDSCCVTGVTSNDTGFATAISGSDLYDEQIRAAILRGEEDPQELFLHLAVEDVGRAADLLLETHVVSDGRDGFVSLGCTPDLAHDAQATIAQALLLWSRLHRPNVMLKVPATDAGILAIEELTCLGVNVNVTLLFSLDRYEQVIEAYFLGLERRLASGGSLREVTSVAAFSVSPLDSKADALLYGRSPLRGRVALANTQRAYALYRERFVGRRWQVLEQAGARRQLPLWAKTATNDPAYSELRYVEELITPGAISTMPLSTLSAFADHGDPDHAVAFVESAAILNVADAVLDLDAISSELEHEGLRASFASYHELLELIEVKVMRGERAGKDFAPADANALEAVRTRMAG